MQPYCNFCIAGVALKLNSVAVELHLLDGYLVYALTSAFILTESQWGQKHYYALLHLNLFTLLILQNIFGTLPVFVLCLVLSNLRILLQITVEPALGGGHLEDYLIFWFCLG